MERSDSRTDLPLRHVEQGIMSASIHGISIGDVQQRNVTEPLDHPRPWRRTSYHVKHLFLTAIDTYYLSEAM